MRTYKATRGPHYDADATMAVSELCQKHFLHLISCERYRELGANNFPPSLRSFERNLFTR